MHVQGSTTSVAVAILFLLCTSIPAIQSMNVRTLIQSKEVLFVCLKICLSFFHLHLLSYASLNNNTSTKLNKTKQTQNKHKTNTKQTQNKHKTNTKQTQNKHKTNTKQTQNKHNRKQSQTPY